MKIMQRIMIAVALLGSLAMATPAQAHWGCHRYHHYGCYHYYGYWHHYGCWHHHRHCW